MADKLLWACRQLSEALGDPTDLSRPKLTDLCACVNVADCDHRIRYRLKVSYYKSGEKNGYFSYPGVTTPGLSLGYVLLAGGGSTVMPDLLQDSSVDLKIKMSTHEGILWSKCA